MYKEKFYHQELENLAEEVVFSELYLEVQKEDVAFCTCDVCIQDIAAITLNHVTPAYITNQLEISAPRNELREKLERVREAVEIELPKAIKVVMDSPHH